MNMSVSLLTVWSGTGETVVCFTNFAPMSYRLAAAPRDGTLIRATPIAVVAWPGPRFSIIVLLAHSAD
jgi:hypothetical protein